MAEELCPGCAGVGAKVIQYPVKDENGYEFMAWRDQTCETCGGKGAIQR